MNSQRMLGQGLKLQWVHKMKKVALDKATITGLAYKGYNVIATAKAVGMCKTLAYESAEFMEAYEKGRKKLTDELSQAMLDKAVGGDVTTQIFLAKRLGLFEKAQPQIRLKSAEDALKAFEEVFNADVSLEAKTALKGVLESYTRTLEVSELEKRLMRLEARK